MNYFYKILLSLLLSTFLLMNNAFSDWTNIKFYKSNGIIIGTAEGVDSWFLNTPSFKFDFKNLESGIYRLALHDGNSCNNYGLSAEINNPKLKPWKPSQLLILEVRENGIFDTTLAMKPDNFTEKTRGLISIGSLRGYPLLLFKDSEKKITGCGMVPLLNASK